MFENDFNFCDELKREVKVFTKCGKSVGSATLTWSSSKLICITFSFGDDLEAFKKNEIFVCKGDQGNITLFDCIVENNHMWPTIYSRLALKGEKNHEQFNKISVLISGVSKWMNNTDSARIENSKVTKDLEDQSFNVVVNDIEGRVIKIFSENVLSVSHKLNETIINEHCLITLEVMEGSFSAQDVITKANEIVLIFSLLSGYSLSIDYVFDWDAKHRNSIYFVNNSDKKELFKDKHECFSQSRYIYQSEKWNLIFKGFYEEHYERFNNLWANYSGMFAYDGVWEYEIFSYLSMLDQYTDIYSNQHALSLSNGEFKKLRRQLKDTIEVVKGGFGDEKSKVIDNISEQLISLKNSNLSTFDERYNFTTVSADQRIIAAINLSGDHFKHMKKIRNAIAHGSKVEIKELGDINYEMLGLRKIKLLLLYWVFLDLGFSSDEFIKILKQAFCCQLVRGACVDGAVIDKAIGGYEFIQLTQSDFDKAKQQKFRGVVLLYSEKQQRYNFHKDGSSTGNDWISKLLEREVCIEQAVISNVDTKDINNIIYVANVYLVCNGEKQKIDGICILNGAEALHQKSSANRKRVFNGEVWEEVEHI